MQVGGGQAEGHPQNSTQIPLAPVPASHRKQHRMDSQQSGVRMQLHSPLWTRAKGGAPVPPRKDQGPGQDRAVDRAGGRTLPELTGAVVTRVGKRGNGKIAKMLHYLWRPQDTSQYPN